MVTNMAVYKVLQDIEAEDKLIGPLTLRQFIYAAIGAVFLWLSYVSLTKGAAFMLVFFLPITAVMGFFAFPWMRDQPTEVWALAKIRFLLKPRRRVWSQDGAKELVVITAPKKVSVDYTNGLSQQEVRSRLRALATAVDTRGWAIKSANLTINLDPNQVTTSDRLVAPIATAPSKLIEDTDIRASDDILDEQNNANAKRLQEMIDQKARARRDQLIANLNSDTPPADKPAAPTATNFWFLDQPTKTVKIPSNMVTFGTQIVAPGSASDDTTVGDTPTEDEASILAELEAHKVPAADITSHMHTIQPLTAQTQHQPTPAPTPAPTPPMAPTPAPIATPPISSPPPATPTPPPPQTPPQNANAPVTPTNQTAILQLASNNDLDVATIAREANRATSGNDEVVIKLR